MALARKSDGLILHDRVLEPEQMDRLSRHVPIVTLAGVATPATANVRGDNAGGMRELSPAPAPRPRLPGRWPTWAVTQTAQTTSSGSRNRHRGGPGTRGDAGQRP